jgi:hypothetical protein
MMGGQRQRLVLDFCTGEIVVRALCKTQDGPGPSTPPHYYPLGEA